MSDRCNSMPSYLSVEDASIVINQMADKAKDVSHSRDAKGNLGKDEACDQARRFYDLGRYAPDWSPIVAEDALAGPR